ncbi:MAG: mannose-6-phosphate isomerase [Robiginitomaculum sp.]|nr:MAG: mannose-6-phosphate isomerase [Robiginitomaculum sp.]
MENLPPEFEKFVNWCKTEALPYWAKAALAPTGGVYECLRMDGTPVTDSLKRVRVQARFSYVYAHASALGWFDNAKTVSDYVWQHVMGPGSQGGEDIPGTGYKGCAHLLAADDSLHDGLRDTYAQAFIILAGSWRYIAFKDNAALNIAKETLAFLDSNVQAGNGGWQEGLPASLPRRQNPHMHLFEALIALYDATQNPQYLNRAGEIYTLFQNTFFDAGTGTIIEFFNQDWTRADNNGGPVEPGHMMEWCWLLRAYEDRSDVEINAQANALYTSALTLGLNTKLGLLYDCVPPPTTGGTLRTWPQTELLKASLAQAKSGDTACMATAANTIQNMFSTYLNVPVKGGWLDQLDAEGAMISITMPTSTFYHFFCAAAEVDAFIKWHKKRVG